MRGRELGAIWLMTAALAAAEEGAAESAEDEKPRGEQQETVVVTASKHGQKITEAPVSITVLTAEDIAATGAVTIVDLFRRVPGLDFAQISARDCQVNARGFNGALSRRLLVLVDGRSVYVDLMGFTLWDTIQVPLEDIARIEVVRGPGSALYGANATSGVVNIITKSPADIDGTFVRAGYGVGDTTDAGFLHGKQYDKLGYKISGGYFRTDEFENPYANYINSGYADDGDTGARQIKASGRLSYDVDDTRRWLVEGGYGGTSGILFTGIGPLDIQPGAYLGFVRAAYTSPHWYLQAFWNRLDGDTLNLTSLQENFFSTDSHDAEAQYHREVGRHFFVFGASARRSIISTDLASRDETETNYGIYAQDEIKLGERFTANVALRVDHDELIGTVAAPKAGLLYAPGPTQSFRLTVATAYNSSSFIESYLDWEFLLPIGEGNVLSITATGNPDLEPERNTTFELGWRAFPLPTLMIDAALFHARLKNFVQFVPVEFYIPGIPKRYTYVNTSEADQTGLELSAEAYLGKGLAIMANYTYTDTDQESDQPGVTAKHKGGVTVQLLAKRLSGSLSFVYSDRLEYDTSTPFYRAETIPAYNVVNGSASYELLSDGRLSLGIRGTNLLDKRHREHIAGDIIERRVLLELKTRF